jgi:hypothetical protein
MNIHTKPTARQIQPMGFSGRLEATRAPTKGKAKKGTKTNRPLTVRLAPQLLGAGAARARTYSATLATNMATERAASDQASQAAARGLILPTPRPCSLASAVTTPLYSTTVS